MATITATQSQPQPQSASGQPGIVGIKTTDLEKLQADLRAANAQIAKLQGSFLNSLTTRSQNDTHQVEIQRKLSAENERLRQTVSDLQQKVDLLSKEILQLEQNLGQSQEQAAGLEAQLIENQAATRKLLGDLEQATLVTQQKANQIEQLQAGNERLSGAFNGLNQEVATLQQQNNQLAAQVAQNQAEKEKKAREAPLRKERDDLLAELNRFAIRDKELLNLARGGFPFYGVFGGIFAGYSLERSREADARRIAVIKKRVKEISDQLGGVVNYPVILYAEMTPSQVVQFFLSERPPA